MQHELCTWGTLLTVVVHDYRNTFANSLLQGNAARYAELKEAQVNYRGDSVDLIHYYIVSSKFAKKHSDWKQLDGKWKVQVVLEIH